MIGLLRVRNEERWLDRCLQSIKPLCQQILVLDDHSTDNTAIIAQRLGAKVISSPFHGLNEARDKDYLLKQAYSLVRLGEWCLWIDGDEELCSNDIPVVQQAVARDKEYCYSLPVLYLWDSETQVRTDGVYGRFTRPSLFRLMQLGLTFKRTHAGGNFHCGNVPWQVVRYSKPLAARLLHYGYIAKDDRMRKYAEYRRRDPYNRLEDGYRHMVIGDVFPAESQFAHAGPLRVEALTL